MQKNERFELSITDISDEGLGIGRAQGFVWFVKDTVPGDIVLTSVMKLGKNYGYARLIKILSPSTDRIEPPCPVASSCGGCQIQELKYAAQLKFKEEKVLSDLIHIGGFDAGRLKDITDPIVAMEYPYRYRNKSVYPLGLNPEGRIVSGFFAARTHSIIETEDCLIGSDKNKIILSALKDFMRERGLEPYDDKTGQGLVRHVMIREAKKTGSLMVSLVINAHSPGKSYAKALVDSLLKADPCIKSISLCINCSRTNKIMGDKLINLYGPGYIEEDISRVKFRISPLSFFQINSVQTEELYKTVLEFADPKADDTAWDLYCGTGTISLLLSQRAKRVYGVEIVSAAVEDARKNARINGIKNVSFFAGKAEEILTGWYEHKALDPVGALPVYAPTLPVSADLIVVDPPRKGCDKKCLETMVRMSPRKIVYVSCNPATLARDLRYLCQNGFDIRRIRPVDMFPQTVSVETVVLLGR